MMNKDEAVNKLAIEGRLSMSRAEDLYDSLFEKPVVPQYVADWYEGHKGNLNREIWEYLTNWDNGQWNDFKAWMFSCDSNSAITTLVNMHQFGYEVEKKVRYTVRVKGIKGYGTYLNKNLENQNWFFGMKETLVGYRTKHTRKELEDANFGWVFDCPGVEVKEVK